MILDQTVYAAKVEGESMQPVLNPRGSTICDFVLLNKWAVRHGKYDRGDIVVLISPRDANHILIKRIIGLEGDTVSLRNETSSGSKTKYTQDQNSFYVIIPSGHCWLEGDHGEKSMDSNNFGPVPLGLIFAKATHIIWPHNRWSRLETFYDKNRIRPQISSILLEDDCD